MCRIPVCRDHLHEDTEGLSSFLAKAGRQVKDSGLVLLYHNYYTELGGATDQRTYLEHMMDMTDPEFVNFEFDVCFMAMKGVDPASFIRRHSRWVRIIYEKDWMPGFSAEVCGIDYGTIDFRSVSGACRDSGISEFIVEQEYFPLIRIRKFC